MDVNQNLNGKQIVIALIVLFGFGIVMSPAQKIVLAHPLIGVVLLAVIALIWWLVRRSSKKSTSA
jgi:hypothetical protein